MVGSPILVAISNRAGANIVHTPGAGWVATVAADVRRNDEAERVVTAAVDELGVVDILVNNTGIGRFGPVSELAVDAWIETIETNLSGVFYCCRAAVSVMKRRGRRGWTSTSAASPASTRLPAALRTARPRRA